MPYTFSVFMHHICSRKAFSLGHLKGKLMESSVRLSTWKGFQALLLLLLLSGFSRVRLCATPQTAAHQAPQSLGFSRQEHWSGLPFPSPIPPAPAHHKSILGDLPVAFPSFDSGFAHQLTLVLQHNGKGVKRTLKLIIRFRTHLLHWRPC